MCAGIAEYLGTDVTFVRLLWVVLSVVPGAVIGGVIAYVAAWVVMPDGAGAAPPAFSADRRRLARSATERKVAGVCGGLAAYLGVDPTLVRLAWVVLAIVPGAVVCGVVAYLVAWFIMPPPTAEAMTAAPSAA